VITKPSRKIALAAILATIAGGLAGTPVASAAAPAPVPGAPGVIRYAESPTAVQGSYVVILHDNTSPDDTPKIADELSQRTSSKKTWVYTSALQGFAVDATESQALEISRDGRVAYVAQDQTYTTQALSVQLAPPSWGLDRIDERSLPLDAKYHYPNNGSSVVAYVIDTGILLTHNEFGGRAFCGFDPWGMGCAPCNQGHGTHVAGTIGGATVGVAKGVRIVSVRVFQCSGSTTAAIVIGGINYVTFAQSINPAQRSVANMSLGGGAFAPMDTAVTNSIAGNVHYSVAAGNSNADACLFSPARVPRATTVGSTRINDNRSAFSNVGACLDLFAPGEGIFSAWYTANNAYATLSGTSMASPHAAGTAAMWRHKFPADNADQTATALAANATPNVVINPGPLSPNLLLFMGMIPV
jgi:subtilisin family serine protease